MNESFRDPEVIMKVTYESNVLWKSAGVLKS